MTTLNERLRPPARPTCKGSLNINTGCGECRACVLWLATALERICKVVQKRQLPITNQVHEIAAHALGIEHNCDVHCAALPPFGPGRMA